MSVIEHTGQSYSHTQAFLVEAIGLTVGWACPGSHMGPYGISRKQVTLASSSNEVKVLDSFRWPVVTMKTQL